MEFVVDGDTSIVFMWGFIQIKIIYIIFETCLNGLNFAFAGLLLEMVSVGKVFKPLKTDFVIG